jgi:hypothetical protein
VLTLRAFFTCPGVAVAITVVPLRAVTVPVDRLLLIDLAVKGNELLVAGQVEYSTRLPVPPVDEWAQYFPDVQEPDAAAASKTRRVPSGQTTSFSETTVPPGMVSSADTIIGLSEASSWAASAAWAGAVMTVASPMAAVAIRLAAVLIFISHPSFLLV